MQIPIKSSISVALRMHARNTTEQERIKPTSQPVKNYGQDKYREHKVNQITNAE